MRKILFATVSVLALTLAASGAYATEPHGMGNGGGDNNDNGILNAAVAASVAVGESEHNYAVGLDSDGFNLLDDHSFSDAKGAFNVGQNNSTNSNVQQSMAIAAVIGRQADIEAALAGSGGFGESEANSFIYSYADGKNLVTDHSFENAKGAFNVLQNNSVNSNASQSTAIAAVIGDDGSNFAAAAVAASVLVGSVSGNSANYYADVSGANIIKDNAFAHAAGAFNVLQNNSVNSNVQQSMSIGAVVNSR